MAKTKISGIYIIYYNGAPVYVGQSVDYRMRASKHLNDMRRGKHANPILQNMYKKNSSDIEIELLEEVPNENLTHMERYWMNMLSPTANILPASGFASREFREYLSKKYSGKPKYCNRGRKQSPEAIAKRTETRRKNGNYKWTPEQKAFISAKMKAEIKEGLRKPPPKVNLTGYKHTEESKRNMSRAHIGIPNLYMKGRKMPVEIITKMVATRRKNGNYFMSEEHKAKLRVALKNTKNIGNRFLPGHKQNTGIKHSPERIEKNRQNRLGVIPSAETLAKRSVSLKETWRKRLENGPCKLSLESIAKRTATRRLNGTYGGGKKQVKLTYLN